MIITSLPPFNKNKGMLRCIRDLYHHATENIFFIILNKVYIFRFYFLVDF